MRDILLIGWLGGYTHAELDDCIYNIRKAEVDADAWCDKYTKLALEMAKPTPAEQSEEAANVVAG